MPTVDFNYQNKRKTVKLKTIPGGEVIVRDILLAGDIEAMEKCQTEIEKTFVLLSRVIQSWNLQDGEGKTLPVTIDNLRKLEIEEINNIANQLSFLKDFLDQTTK